jgi:hypothetical protein
MRVRIYKELAPSFSHEFKHYIHNLQMIFETFGNNSTKNICS